MFMLVKYRMPIGPHTFHRVVWRCWVKSGVLFCGQAALSPFNVLRYYAFDSLFHVVSTSPHKSGVEDHVDVLAVWSRRRTVPVCVPDTEADVLIALCERPESALADPSTWGSQFGEKLASASEVDWASSLLERKTETEWGREVDLGRDLRKLRQCKGFHEHLVPFHCFASLRWQHQGA